MNKRRTNTPLFRTNQPAIIWGFLVDSLKGIRMKQENYETAIQLSEAIKERDQLKAELAEAQAENARLSELASLKLSRNRIKELQTEIERLKAALDLHEHEIIELHGYLEIESAHLLECQQIIYGLREELAKAEHGNEFKAEALRQQAGRCLELLVERDKLAAVLENVLTLTVHDGADKIVQVTVDAERCLQQCRDGAKKDNV